MSAFTNFGLCAKEDFLTWTESDPNSKLTQTSDRATWIDMKQKDNATYLFRNGTFKSMFTHKLDFKLEYIDVNENPTDEFLCLAWGVLEKEGRPCYVESGKSVTIWITENGENWINFYLYLEDTNDINQDSSTLLNVDQKYYLTIIRNNAIFTCFIYSDSSRSNLVDTISITVGASDNIQFNYIMTTACPDSGTSYNDQSDGYVENLNIEIPPEPFVDRYTMVGIGLAGLILMAWCPTWIALKFRKKGLEVETIETMGYAMLLFFVGFGFFIIWIYS